MKHDAGRIAWASEVDEALRTLDTDEQSFLRLSYFAGVTQERIAENAGVQLASVSRTIASGMRRLGRALELSPAPVSHRPAWLTLVPNSASVRECGFVADIDDVLAPRRQRGSSVGAASGDPRRAKR